MRRLHDFYPTPEWATKELLRYVAISGEILECCAGQGDMAKILERVGKVYCNDIDTETMSPNHWDATRPSAWEERRPWDWVVTNPPFSVAAEIVPLAFKYAQTGIAMLLRLSYLEPVENRGSWLHDNPPNTLIVLPRISFTGDGKTDSVTCAWMIWRKPVSHGFYAQRIIIARNPRFA